MKLILRLSEHTAPNGSEVAATELRFVNHKIMTTWKTWVQHCSTSNLRRHLQPLFNHGPKLIRLKEHTQNTFRMKSEIESVGEWGHSAQRTVTALKKGSA
jgi:hypothetical protein